MIFFGGAYGNFLEYICNRYIFKTKGTSITPFLPSGASHQKNHNKEYQDNKVVSSGHFSYFTAISKEEFVFNTDDIIIRVNVDKNSLYHVYYNSLMRAGDQILDLIDLEVDTLDKLEQGGQKFSNLKNQIISDFGIKKNYKRSSIRNYFYSAIRESKFSLREMNSFIDFNCNKYINFNIRNVETFVSFVSALQNLSLEITSQPFKYDMTLLNLYNEFFKKNQGIQSFNKCNNVLDCIFKGDNVNIELLIIEEAYINSIITEVFNIHSGIDCFTDEYPSNTRVIYEQIMGQTK